MPVSNPIIAGDLIGAGIRSEFSDVYRLEQESMQAMVSDCMELNIPSSTLTETFAYLESSPYPSRWDRGTTIPHRNFDSVQFQVSNLDWGLRISWHRNDLDDDATRSLLDQARLGGQHFASLDLRVLTQILQNVADPDLLPTVPLCADGAALYATTAGGLDRFGTVSGNLLTGTGITGAAIRVDFFSSIEQFRLFQDTEGLPLHPMSAFPRGYKILYNPANHGAFLEAFRQETTESTSTNAGVQNLVMVTGEPVELVPLQYLTGNSWYIFMKGAHKKAIFSLDRMGLETHEGNMQNSDFSKDTLEEWLQFRVRRGYGCAVPFSTIRVNN